MDDDESVRRLLLPLGDWPPDEIGDWRHYVQVQQFLATADANLGNPKAAKRRLRALDDDERRVQTLRDALRQGKPGLGLIPRFAYYYSYELMPGKGLEEFSALVEATDDGSQAGSDEQRMNALLSLQASGGAQPGEAFRIWRNGVWTEIELRGFTIGPRKDRPQYKAKVAQLMEQGQAAMRAGQSAEAAALLRQAIDLEPRAYEAYNNLAAALDMTGDREASRALLEKALTINPTFVFARVNLAVKLLDQGADAAAACLAPLEALTSFTPEEFVFYQYGLAQVAVAREDYDAARNLLDMALSIAPDYVPAKKLLALVGDIEFREGVGGIWGKLRKRLADSNAQYRRQQQAKLATLAPSVADVVGIYSAEVIRPIAKAITPWQRLTGLRKAELQRLVNETLLEWQFTLPESVAGRLRLHCLLVETTVAGVVYLAVPVELRGPLETALRSRLNGVRAAHAT